MDDPLTVKNFLLNPVAPMLGEARGPVPDMVPNKIIIGNIWGWEILGKVVVDTRNNLNEVGI